MRFELQRAMRVPVAYEGKAWPAGTRLPYLWFGVPDRIESYTSTTGCDISDGDKLSLKSDFMSINRYSKKIEIIKN